MFKQVMTHEILPGKLPDVKKWLQNNCGCPATRSPPIDTLYVV